MAHGYSRRGDRTRSRIYIISALLIIALVVVYIYGSYPFGQKGVVATSTGTVGPVESKKILNEVKPNLFKFVQTTAKDNPRAAELVTEAITYIDAKPARIIDARERLNETLPMPMSEQQQAFIKKQLSGLADKWLFSRTIFPQDKLTGSYKVLPGDLLR